MKTVLDWLLSAKAVGTLITVIIAVIVWTLFTRGINRIKNRRVSKGEDTSYYHLFVSVIKFLIILSAVLVVLQTNGVNITSMIAGLGIVSAIVGLALQDILKDVIMGMHVVSDRFFSVGDAVLYGEKEGKVIAFTLKTTQIELFEDKSVISVCNRNISEIRRFTNLLYFYIPVPYSADGETADKTLFDAAKEMQSIEGVDSVDYKGLDTFGESAIMYKFIVFCKREDKYRILRSSMQIVKRKLDGVGINIPFNQLDVHIDK